MVIQSTIEMVEIASRKKSQKVFESKPLAKFSFLVNGSWDYQCGKITE